MTNPSDVSASSPSASASPSAFYLQSRVQDDNYVLARNAAGKVRLAHLTGAIGQLWLRQDDPRGGFFLVNAETGQVLYQTRSQGGEVELHVKDSNPGKLWKVDPFGGGIWMGLTAFRDWEQKLNIFGNGPYNENSTIGLWEYSRGAANECWMMVAETGLVTVESITYDMSLARLDFSTPPRLCEATVVDNRASDITLKTAVELARSRTTSRQFSYTTSTSDALKIAEKLGTKMSIDKIVEVSGEVSVERTTTKTVTFGQQDTQSETVSDKVTVSVDVPGRSRIEYMVRVYYGSVSVPYKARVSHTMPDGSKQYSDVNGVYTNVNSIKYDIVTVDPASGAVKPLQSMGAAESLAEPSVA